MKNHPLISEVADLLMYCGPSIEDTISEAIRCGNRFKPEVIGDITKLTVFSTTAYSLSVEDIFYYDADRKLIKQILVINGNEKTVFDKYAEAEAILITLNQSSIQAS